MAVAQFLNTLQYALPRSLRNQGRTLKHPGNRRFGTTRAGGDIINAGGIVRRHIRQDQVRKITLLFTRFPD
jgi:hypothetical protein